MPRLRVLVISFAVLLAAVLALLFWRERVTMVRHHAVPHELEVAASVVGFPDEVRKVRDLLAVADRQFRETALPSVPGHLCTAKVQ